MADPNNVLQFDDKMVISYNVPWAYFTKWDVHLCIFGFFCLEVKWPSLFLFRFFLYQWENQMGYKITPQNAMRNELPIGR